MYTCDPWMREASVKFGSAELDISDVRTADTTRTKSEWCTAVGDNERTAGRSDEAVLGVATASGGATAGRSLDGVFVAVRAAISAG